MNQKVLEKQIKIIAKKHEDDIDEISYHRAVRKEVGPFKAIIADWKEIDESILKQFVRVMRKAGLDVVYDPRFEGSDMYCILIFMPKTQ